MNSATKDFLRERVCLYSPIPWAQGYEEMMMCAAAEGLRGVELLNAYELRVPDMTEAKRIGAVARKNRLFIPCFSVGMSLVGEDRPNKVAIAKKYIDICAELEIPYFHHTVFGGRIDAERAATVFEEGVDSAVQLSEYAIERGLHTLVEDQGYMVNGVENYRKFRAATKNAFDVLLDVGNIYFADESAGDFADAFCELIKHVHLKDYFHRKTVPENTKFYRSISDKYIYECEAGEGDVDIERVKNALARVSYRGIYSMEYSWQTVDQMYSTFDYVASVFGDV